MTPRLVMSKAWLTGLHRATQRVDFHSAPIQFPVRKLKNETAKYMTRVLRGEIKRRA